MINEQIYILYLIGIILIFQILSIIIIYKIFVDPKYKKFYITPAMAVIKTMKDDKSFKKRDIITLSIIIYLLETSIILPFWVLGWCFYKCWRFIFIDFTQYYLKEEEKRGDKSKQSPIPINDDSIEILTIKVENELRADGTIIANKGESTYEN